MDIPVTGGNKDGVVVAEWIIRMVQVEDAIAEGGVFFAADIRVVEGAARAAGAGIPAAAPAFKVEQHHAGMRHSRFCQTRHRQIDDVQLGEGIGAELSIVNTQGGHGDGQCCLRVFQQIICVCVAVNRGFAYRITDNSCEPLAGGEVELVCRAGSQCEQLACAATVGGNGPPNLAPVAQDGQLFGGVNAYLKKAVFGQVAQPVYDRCQVPFAILCGN